MIRLSQGKKESSLNTVIGVYINEDDFTIQTLFSNMLVLRLQDYKITRLQDYKITRLQDYKITRLQDYK